MRISLRQLLGLVAVIAVACLIATWFLRLTANDFWGYGKLGVGNGTTTSPVYYIEVRGVGSTPTIARVVRFKNYAAAPNNRLLVSHAVSADLQAHVQNIDRWSRTLTLVAGRTIDEKITLTLDGSTAKRLFAQPGSQFDDYQTCVKLWDEHIAPHMPEEPDS
jgi:hypothetical protein